jgi:hypothetical protein
MPSQHDCVLFVFLEGGFGFWDASLVFVCLLFFELLSFRFRGALHPVRPFGGRHYQKRAHTWLPPCMGSSKCPQPRALPTSFLISKFRFFFLPPIKLKLGLQIGLRLLINSLIPTWTNQTI